jgi:peptide deformylase
VSIEIILLGNPLLRQQSQVVDDIATPEVQALGEKMLGRVKAMNGMGIAAPQLGTLKRMFVMASHPNQRYPYAPMMEATVVINPRIIAYSENKEKGWEGCLSVPGLRGEVWRHKHIDVTYQTMNGNQIETRYEGFLARIFQHETDHLDGYLFVDRVESAHDLMVEAEWQKQVVPSMQQREAEA